jgi:hypothetical protein
MDELREKQKKLQIESNNNNIVEEDTILRRKFQSKNKIRQINFFRDDVRRKLPVIKDDEAKDIDKLFKSKKKD